MFLKNNKKSLKTQQIKSRKLKNFKTPKNLKSQQIKSRKMKKLKTSSQIK